MDSAAVKPADGEEQNEVEAFILDGIEGNATGEATAAVAESTSSSTLTAEPDSSSQKQTLESEYLYLIAKHLKSVDAYSQIGKQLEQTITEQGVLGQSYNWDGSSRPARMEDIDRKFSSVPSTQLLDLLNHIVSKKNATTATAIAITTGKISSKSSPSNSTIKNTTYVAPVTLLKPIHDIKSFKGRTSLDKEAPSIFIDDNSNLRAVQQEIKDKKIEIVNLARTLADIEAMTDAEADENLSNGKSSGTMNGKGDIIDETINIEIQLLGDDGPNDALMDTTGAYEASVSDTYKTSCTTRKVTANRSMKAAGIHRRQRGILQQITELEKKETILAARRDISHKALLASDSLSSQFQRGWFATNRLDWLNNRTLGISPSCFSNPMSSEAECTSFHIGRANICKFQYLYSISCHGYNPAYCAVFDKTGRFLLTGADDYLVKVFDVEKGLLLYTCRGHMGFVTFIAISPDNSLFATACVKGSIRIWRLRDGACLKIVKHNESINTLKFDTWTGALVSGGDDGVCKIWVIFNLFNIRMPFYSIPTLIIPNFTNSISYTFLLCIMI